MVTYAEAKRQLEIARQQEVPKAIEKIHALMNEYGLTLADLRIKGRRGRPRKTAAAKVKYKYMKDGMGYTGVGRRPAWVEALLKAGDDLEKYRIGGAAPAAAAKKPAAAKAALKKKAAPAKKTASLKKPAAKAAAKRAGKIAGAKAAK